MDPIFEHPAFDLAKEKMKHFIRHFEKSQEDLENLLYTCFKCGSNNIFSVAKQVRSAERERLYLMSVVIVTINGWMDDTHYATNFKSNFHGRCSQTTTPSISILLDILGYDVSVKGVLFGSLKINHHSYMIQQLKATRKFISYI